MSVNGTVCEVRCTRHMQMCVQDSQAGAPTSSRALACMFARCCKGVSAAGWRRLVADLNVSSLPGSEEVIVLWAVRRLGPIARRRDEEHDVAPPHEHVSQHVICCTCWLTVPARGNYASVLMTSRQRHSRAVHTAQKLLLTRSPGSSAG